MHVEIQVALNFLISFLYNKLPRRRVNQFGEELENALKVKFEGHWYPEKPYKGSAYRCVRCAPPLDPTVFDTAARASGMDLIDIQENLPQELSIWIDPGEVSYRMSEKGPVKILYSEKTENCIERENVDREVTRTFNPEAQCFKPIECLSSQFGHSLNLTNGNAINTTFNEESSPPVYKNSVSPINSFMVSKASTPVIYTAGTFAATKFGSTKLKSNSKRSHRMSPTEFSNYIKQRAILQQQVSQQPSPIGMSPMSASANNNPFSSNSTSTVSPHNSRSISPTQLDSGNNCNNYLLMSANGANSPTSPNGSYGSGQSLYTSNTSTPSKRNAYMNGLFDNNYLSELVGAGESPKANNGQHQQKAGNHGMNRFTSFLDKTNPFISSPNPTSPSAPNSFGASNLNFGSLSNDTNVLNGTSNTNTVKNSSKSFDNINFNVNGVSYPNQYQHLLVAN